MSAAHGTVTAGGPEPLGLSLDAEGANIAVFSRHATQIELCLFAEDGEETARIPLPARTGPVHHAHIAGIAEGQRYGLRAHGPYDPALGHRFNPAKLLLDPWASALTGPIDWHPALRGHAHGASDLPCPVDSAPHLPKCVATAPLPEIDPAERPDTPWPDTVIYEAHAKGLTQLWSGLDPALAGTVEALGTPEVIAYLRTLGITAIELLPIQAKISEPRLSELGLSNYWGYNTAAWMVPEPRLLGPHGVAGLRQTVRRLHAAGIEVILDVVFNHSGEGDAGGPTLSLRGLDNASCYRLGPHGYANETGCGNTVDLAEPYMLRLVMDALRFWATRIGADGFRFDLAPALLRRGAGFEPPTAFLDAIAQDPVLSRLKLIAEPWDIGPEGYRLGRFPAPWAEWNDWFRDALRGFWRGDEDAVRHLPEAMLGSAAVFDRGGRPAWSSVNLVTAHDGFTLADLTMYSARRNAANGEDGRDGHAHNLSDNLGVEGPSERPEILEARRLRRRSLMASLLLAQGTPMILAGDEIGSSQGGNNNAYCQDNEVSWIDWAAGDPDLMPLIRRLTALRRALPALRLGSHLHARALPGGAVENEWLGLGGGPVDWEAPGLDGFALVIRGADGDPAGPHAPVIVAVNRGSETAEIHPPAGHWTRLLDTALPGGEPDPADGFRVPPGAVILLGPELPADWADTPVR